MQKKKSKENKDERITDFLFEVGTMRKLLRMHRQVLFTEDTTDSIATHSYRVAIIAWMIAKIEGADPYKTVMMALFHDIGEIRSGDHNWIHKKYVKIFEDEIIEEQLGTLPFNDLFDFLKEYEIRESKESIIAKDADIIDQILLLREYEWQGNKEAHTWLDGKRGPASKIVNRLVLASSKKLAETITKRDPSKWWVNIYTGKNR
ncbi:MAG: HD domain-containing protein [Candidatus Paceibacterota bacterium]